PPIETSTPGLFVVNSAQIVNSTLNVNETVRLAEASIETLCRPLPERLTGRCFPLQGSGALQVNPQPHPPMPKPIASLSLDLDNKWSYLKTHGDGGWANYPSYLDRVVPRFLGLLDDVGILVTVFVVGHDAARQVNYDVLAPISAAQ